MVRTLAIIAGYNEEKRIGNVVKGAGKYVDRVIVIDDGSTDRTSKVAKSCGAMVIRQLPNQGVGAATARGIRHALRMRPEKILILDADGQHKPEYIPQFIAALGDADYVYGRRDLSNYPFNRKIGNFGLTLLSNLLCPTGIKDTECGYRAFKYHVAKNLRLSSKRYEREMDFIWNVWKNKWKVAEIKIVVPVFHPKRAIMRGLHNFWWLFKRRMS